MFLSPPAYWFEITASVSVKKQEKLIKGGGVLLRRSEPSQGAGRVGVQTAKREMESKEIKQPLYVSLSLSSPWCWHHSNEEQEKQTCLLQMRISVGKVIWSGFHLGLWTRSYMWRWRFGETWTLIKEDETEGKGKQQSVVMTEDSMRELVLFSAVAIWYINKQTNRNPDQVLGPRTASS